MGKLFKNKFFNQLTGASIGGMAGGPIGSGLGIKQGGKVDDQSHAAYSGTILDGMLKPVKGKKVNKDLLGG